MQLTLRRQVASELHVIIAYIYSIAFKMYESKYVHHILK